MRHYTAKALGLIPPATYTVSTTGTDYGQSTEPRETRGIFTKAGQDVLYLVATQPLGVRTEQAKQADVLAELWAKSPELLAALSALVQMIELSGAPDTKVLQYAKETLHRTETAMLQAFAK